MRLNNNKYEIIVGQRRYLAMKQLNKKKYHTIFKM
jgi:ParB-like chromosome segregation protein Spo0J